MGDQMMLDFPDLIKLNTKPIVFEKVYTSLDPGTHEQIKELTCKRRVLEESINHSSSVTEAIAREISGGLTSQSEQNLQKLEQYLPLLENLVHHVYTVNRNSRVASLASDLRIRWSSAISSSSLFGLKGQKFFQINSLRFELSMTLFLYGAMLREQARAVLLADLISSAGLYRKAAGVFNYLANEVLPLLQPTLASSERPPEASSGVSSVMSLVCLAEAQAVTIRKAEEKGSTAGVLAKLHYGASEFLDEAIVVLQSATKECRPVSTRFVDFISSSKALHELRSYRHLAEGLKMDGQFGVAIGLLRHALSNVRKKYPREESWRLIFKRDIDFISGLLRKYEHENDFVWHEKIPIVEELPVPEGKKIVSILPYAPQRWERPLAFK